MVAQAEVGNNPTSHENKDEGSWNPGIKVTVEATLQQLVTLIASFSAPFWSIILTTSFPDWYVECSKGQRQHHRWRRRAASFEGLGDAQLWAFFPLCSLHTQVLQHPTVSLKSSFLSAKPGECLSFLLSDLMENKGALKILADPFTFSSQTPNSSKTSGSLHNRIYLCFTWLF